MILPAAVIGKTASIQIKPGEYTAPVLDLAKAAGFGMVRRAIQWGQTETTKGTYVFVEPDAFFANMAARGTWAIVTLHGNNSLYETGTVGIVTQAGRDGFAAFAAACVARYAGRNIIWEIWNEPNITSFWHAPSNSNTIADEYTALVKLTVPAMMARDPSAYVVAGSISALWSESFQWFDRCIAQGILASGIKGVSVHPYGFSWPELAVTGYDVIRSKVGTLSIVTSEVGYPLSWISERQGFTAAEAPVVQGHLLVRQQLVDLMSGLGLSNWYELHSAPSYAIVDGQYAPLPAYNAAQVLMGQLAGYKFIRRVPTDSPLDYVIYLRHPTSLNRKLAVWTVSDVSAPSPRKPIPHTIEIAMSGSDGPVSFVDCYGNPGTATLAAGKAPMLLEGGQKYLDIVRRNVAT